MTVQEDVRKGNGPFEPPTPTNLNFNAAFATALAALAAGGFLLLLLPGIRTPTLHTILDTTIFETSALLALLFWQLGSRAEQVSARLLAILFVVVAGIEAFHTFAAFEWNTGAPISPRVADHLTGTWGPSSYLLPGGLLLLPLLQNRGRHSGAIAAAVYVGLALVLLLLFDRLPRFSHAGMLGITRPTLVLVPLLWVAVAWPFWQARNNNEANRLIALTAMLFVIPHTAILFSHSPYDGAALFAHTGKLVGRVFLLMSLTLMGARSSTQLVRAQQQLRVFNEDLEHRIRQRTLALEEANAGLSAEIAKREGAERKLRTQVERLNLLNQITAAIGDRLDLGSIFQIVIRSLVERLPVDFASVMLFDEKRETLVVGHVACGAAVQGSAPPFGEQEVVAPDGLTSCVGGKLVYQPDIAAIPHPLSARLAQQGLRALVVAPFVVDREPLGVLVVARRQTESFESGDCEFVAQLCDHVSLAIRQNQLHTTLQRAYDDLRATQQAVLQQERLRALGQMASGIAHDINNAISPVALYTKSLLETETRPDLRSYLETVRRVTNDVAATVARMREFYRPRELDDAQVPVNLNELVDHVLDLTRARWSDMPQQRGIVIAVDKKLQPDLPRIAGTASEIREALTNLVFNAIDAMPEGGTLRLATRAIPPTNGAPLRVQVETADTGQGMDDATKARCLEPFFTTKGERGTGLGMAMVYGAAKRHEAALEIESEPGYGTTVRLTFAALDGTAEAPVSTPAPAAPVSRPLRILLVDDDSFVLDSLRVVLELDGHTITEANGGKAGIDTFLAALGTAEAFDIVVTDLGMPFVDGNQVIAALKAASPDTPIVLLTGWGRQLDADGTSSSRADFVLSKPPDLDELRGVFAGIKRR